MKRQDWAVAGMVFVAPCLVFTVWALFLAFYALQFASFGFEWWVENRTAEPVWVTPVVRSDGRVVRLPHYPSRLVTYSTPPAEEVLVLPGERRKLVIDAWVQTDIGGPEGLIIRTNRGDYRSLTRPRETPGWEYVLNDLSSLPPATGSEIAEVQRPLGPVNFGIPLWVVVPLGLAAPVALWRLRRISRAQAL